MIKLKLEKIFKIYRSVETVTALKDVSLKFRQNEFVSILGPSGCGKTTLLNIIGGLDRYDSGDLVINGTSTSTFRSAGWDAYRNRSIGFVFQNYHLIGHQSVLRNVEIALTLSGVSPSERKRRARQALTDVGLSDQMRKKPNQLSGGQMQRVAIARALVNNPDIILADEPTGALDSHISVQIMEILKEIAQTRLVIMVTHNTNLAKQYSDRIIRLLDGEIQSDSNPPMENGMEAMLPDKKRGKFGKTSMSLITAAGLSFKNLLTKRGRAIMTSFAGSIGIFGVALVLALSGGLSAYMENVQTETLSGYPITITSGTQPVIDVEGETPFAQKTSTYSEFPADDTLYKYDWRENQKTHTNMITDEYLAYISKIKEELPNAVNTVSYQRGTEMNLLIKNTDSIIKFESQYIRMDDAHMIGLPNSFLQEMPDNDDFVLSLYDLIGEGSRLPNARNEIMMVVDKYNRQQADLLSQFGMKNGTCRIGDFMGKTLKLIDNNDFYTKKEDLFIQASPAEYQELYDRTGGMELTVVGVLRIKEDAASSYFTEGLVYTAALADYVDEAAKNSEIAHAQKNSNQDILTGMPFSDEAARKERLSQFGADTIPAGINIYPVNFAANDSIKSYLDAYNTDRAEENQIIYTDWEETAAKIFARLINTISYSLICFAGIALLVSTIMIGIITYVSVIERTKEIGILRSVGARKKDISRVFIAEAMIIGFTAGVIGTGLSYLLAVPLNETLAQFSGISEIVALNSMHSIILIAGSMGLTLIAGLFPSRIAARKDPVEALRAE
ncbi:MAG: ATP-binding cassette domain-containing protein [Peptococcaceae bacterium]|nr:ATP-binding cassette domain-containing protein [Peptococcaceae bacterium]